MPAALSKGVGLNAFLWLALIVLAVGVAAILATLAPRRRTFRRTEVVQAGPAAEPMPEPRPGERIVRRDEVDGSV